MSVVLVLRPPHIEAINTLHDEKGDLTDDKDGERGAFTVIGLISAHVDCAGRCVS